MFVVKFKTDNEAFKNGSGNAEVTRILEEIAEDYASGRTEGNIRDINGNHVGYWETAQTE
ncbi:MAG: hypothetical protein WC374_04690 [Phycisphaerae bacterium]